MSLRVTALWAVLLLTLLLAFSACTVVSVSGQPARPESVPDEALWVGGADGGAFLLVKPSGGNRYAAQVFSEGGESLFDGTLVLDREEERPFAHQDVNSYSAWDGEKILLADGRSLIRRRE